LQVQTSRYRGAETFERRRDITHDESGLDAHDTIARAQECAIPTRISADRARVIATVNFDDEP